ncbi:MAG: DUF1622 domain-containing protein [Clostridiales bacterium]|nr:DUF1622 domain-containing protein [Clostridiales bacterium]
MLETIINSVAPFIINILELIGIFITTFTSVQCFYGYLKNKLNPDNRAIKIKLAQGIALALEFKLASEIIKTVIVRDIAEIYVLGAIIIIRVILTFVIHWEIKTEMGAQ